MTKNELKELIKEVINEETQSVDPEEILGEILELTTSDTSDPLLILMKIRALAKNYFDKVGYKVNEGYATDSGKKAAKERIVKLKAEYDRINKLKDSSDYLDTNDPQARNFHNKRLKEIPKEISKIRQKILDI